MCPTDDIRLPPVLEGYLSGLRAGSGTSSPPSRSTIDGASSVLKPIVLSLSAGTGLKHFLTALATIYALKEERSGEHMVTLSWGLEREALRSLIEHSQSAGNSDEIGFDLSIQALAPDTTSPNMWSREQMFGISGGLCDHCNRSFHPTQSYTVICNPASTQHLAMGASGGGQLSLYHTSCTKLTMR